MMETEVEIPRKKRFRDERERVKTNRKRQRKGRQKCTENRDPKRNRHRESCRKMERGRD